MNGAQVEAAWDESAEAKGRPSFGQLAKGLVPVPRTTGDIVTSRDQQQWGYDPAGRPTPAVRDRVSPLLASLPPGVADQIERAAAAPEGDVLYAACWCDDGAHAEADSTAWRTTRERAERDQLQALGPESHLMRQTQITEVIA